MFLALYVRLFFSVIPVFLLNFLVTLNGPCVFSGKCPAYSYLRDPCQIHNETGKLTAWHRGTAQCAVPVFIFHRTPCSTNNIKKLLLASLF